LLSAGKGYLRATFFATFYSFGIDRATGENVAECTSRK
jgi:hypothetical protein